MGRALLKTSIQKVILVLLLFSSVWNSGVTRFRIAPILRKCFSAWSILGVGATFGLELNAPPGKTGVVRSPLWRLYQLNVHLQMGPKPLVISFVSEVHVASGRIRIWGVLHNVELYPWELQAVTVSLNQAELNMVDQPYIVVCWRLDHPAVYAVPKTECLLAIW